MSSWNKHWIAEIEWSEVDRRYICGVTMPGLQCTFGDGGSPFEALVEGMLAALSIEEVRKAKEPDSGDGGDDGKNH